MESSAACSCTRPRPETGAEACACTVAGWVIGDDSGGQPRVEALAVPTADPAMLEAWRRRFRAALGPAADRVRVDCVEGRLRVSADTGDPELRHGLATVLAGTADWSMVEVVPTSADRDP